MTGKGQAMTETGVHLRMLEKDRRPAAEEIRAHMGSESFKRLQAFEALLDAGYRLEKELRFLFGNDYGWGNKYSHGKTHLCYAFFEQASFTVSLQIGDRFVASVENALSSLLPKTRDQWANRYPCGERGGWLNYRVLSDEELADLRVLIAIKKPPSIRRQP